MKIAFLFPGQGSQYIGMGKDIYDKYPEVQKIYDKVSKITGKDIAQITFYGTENELNKTANTQICILTMSLGILEILKQKHIKPQVLAGLSLGEYVGLIHSGILNFNDGVKIVQKRGEIMQNYTPKGEWAMSAVLGLEADKVEEACKKVKSGFVAIANYNCPGQLVISGEKVAVEEAECILKEYGVKKTRILNVAGPFHTEKLYKCSQELEKQLKDVKLEEFKIPVIKNIDGTKYSSNDNVKQILTNHIIKPVKFETTLQTMIDMGIDTFIEIGPGKTLSGFVKRINSNKQINILSINNIATLESTIDYLKEVEI